MATKQKNKTDESAALQIDVKQVKKNLKLTLDSWKKDKSVSPELLKSFTAFVSKGNIIDQALFFRQKKFVLPPLTAGIELKKTKLSVFLVCCRAIRIEGNSETEPVRKTPIVVCHYYLASRMPSALPVKCTVTRF